MSPPPEAPPPGHGEGPRTSPPGSASEAPRPLPPGSASEGSQTSPDRPSTDAPASSATWRPAPPSHRTADLSPAVTPSHELAAGASFGRFRIERLLGQGGMGRVYEAHDGSLERLVALKVLHEGGGAGREAAMRGLLREARAVAALRHEGVVTIYEAGECDGTPYIAMELLEGAPLRRHIGAPDPSPDRKLAWSLDIARALASAHDAGLVHRDVKPENIFVCLDGRAKLLDFGIAAREPAADDASTAPAAPHPVGTPRYMPPEQREGRAPDARSDQYAWALTTYELLCGTHEGATSADAAARLRASAPSLSERAAAAIERCLRPEPSARFASMHDVIAELTAAPSPAHALEPTSASPEPVDAPSPARSQRPLSRAITTGASSAQRRRTFAALAALTALTALAAFAVYLTPRLVTRGPGAPCSLEGAEALRLEGPAPDSLMALARDDGLLLYGAFADASRVPSGLSRARLKGSGEATALEPFDPFNHVFPPEGLHLNAAFWRGEEVLAVYSDSLGSVGVWGPRGPVSGLRLDHTSLGFATAVAADSLFGVSLGTTKAKPGTELVSFVMRSTASPLHDVLYRAAPGEPLSRAAIAATSGRALITFVVGDRLLASVIDEQGRREGDARELARGAVGPPLVASAGSSGFIVAWPERPTSTGPIELRAVALPADGRPAGRTHTLGQIALASAPAPPFALAPSGEGAVVAWPETAGSVVVRTLSPDASPATKPLSLEAAGGVRSLAVTPRPGGAWVAWVEAGPPSRTRAGALRCEAPAVR